MRRSVADSPVVADVALRRVPAEVSTPMSTLELLVGLVAIWAAAFLGAYCGIAAFFLLKEREYARAQRRTHEWGQSLEP